MKKTEEEKLRELRGNYGDMILIRHVREVALLSGTTGRVFSAAFNHVIARSRRRRGNLVADRLDGKIATLRSQ